jgi:hypothetical protein
MQPLLPSGEKVSWTVVSAFDLLDPLVFLVEL